MRRYNKVSIALMSGCLIFLILIGMMNITPTSQASYSDQIQIDNIQEPEYEKIADMEGYQIWYSYNNTFHFLYFVVPFNFTNEVIKIRNQNDEFSYTFSPLFPVNNAFLKTRFANNTMELSVKQELIGNNFIVEIKIYTFVLSVNPEARATVPKIVYEEGKKEEAEEKLPESYISPYGVLKITWMWMTRNPVLYALYPFLTFYLLFVFVRTCFRPYVFYKNKKGKSRYAGRYAFQKPSEKFLGFWEIYFKRFKRMNLVYSKMSYTQQLPFCYMDAGIVKYFSDFIYKEVPLREDMGIFFEKELVDSFGNKVKYYIYRILSIFIYGTLVPQWIENILDIQYKTKTKKMNGEIKKTKKKKNGEMEIIYHQIEQLDAKGNSIPIRVEEIPILQHQLSFDKINITCDIEYDILETSGAGEEKIHKTETNKSIFYKNDLARNQKILPDSIKESNYHIEVIPNYDLEQAIMQQDHIDNIRSIADLKVSKINKDFIELDQKYNLTRSQLDDMNRHIKSIIMDKIQEIYQKTVVDADTIVEIVSLALTGYKQSGNIEEAALNAFREYNEKRGSQIMGDVKMQLQIEKGKVQVLEKTVKQLQDNRMLLYSPEKEPIDAGLGND